MVLPWKNFKKRCSIIESIIIIIKQSKKEYTYRTHCLIMFVSNISMQRRWAKKKYTIHTHLPVRLDDNNNDNRRRRIRMPTFYR